MDPRYWTKSVDLAVTPGRLRKVRSTLQAEECLHEWPVSPGDAHMEAIRVCRAVLRNGAPRQMARDAFVLAAKEAGIYVEPHRRPILMEADMTNPAKGKQSADGLMKNAAKEERDTEVAKGSPLKKGVSRFEERSRSSDGKSAGEKQER